VVTVDHTIALPQLIQASGFDAVNTDINSENFRPEGSGSENETMVLVSFNDSISSAYAAQHVMSTLGLRPAKLDECLAYAEQLHAHARTNHVPVLSRPFVCLGQIMLGFQDQPCEPIVWSDFAGNWRLMLGPWWGVYQPVYKFLAVKNPSHV
jgi:hypothetical protein